MSCDALPYEVPMIQIPMIVSVREEIAVLGKELTDLITALRKTGNSGLVFHDPVTKELVPVLANVNEVFVAMMQEAEDSIDKVKYVQASNTITQPDKFTTFGQSVFSDTAVWGACESRKWDQTMPGALEAKYKSNLATDRNKRTWCVEPVSGLQQAVHFVDEEEDRVSAQIIEKLSELSLLKARLLAFCTVNARLDRFQYEAQKKEEMKASGQKETKEEAPKKDAAASADDKEKKEDMHTTIVKLITASSSPIKKHTELAVPKNREYVIGCLLDNKDGFSTPYKAYLQDDTRRYKTMSTQNLISKKIPRKAGSQMDKNVVCCWREVCKMRVHELKSKYSFHKKIEIDPETTDVKEFDRFTSDYAWYCINNTTLPSSYASVKILDVDGSMIRMTEPSGNTRAPNYVEYAAMCLRSEWSSSVILVTADLNCNSGLYANCKSAQMVLPGKYLFKLKQSDKSAPKLKMPLVPLFDYMEALTEGRKDRDAEYIAESMIGLGCSYKREAVGVPIDEIQAIEGAPTAKRQRTDDDVQSHGMSDHSMGQSGSE